MAKNAIKFVILFFLLASIMLFASGCKSTPQKYMLDKKEAQEEKIKQQTGVANPATLFCMNQTGNSWSIKEDSDGNQQGICGFSDGSWCDEWDYFKGNCKIGTNYTECGGQFWGKSVCPPEYEPVCARIEVGNQAPYTIRYETFSHPCKACISSTKTEVVVGYTHGSCAQ